MLFSKRRYNSLTELVEGCQRRERKAQNAFYDRYQRKMLGVCRRYARTLSEAEDIFQEAFIKVFTKIDDLKTPESADGWVKSIIIRTALSYYERTTKKELMSTPIDLNVQDWDSVEFTSWAHVDIELVLKVLSELPNGYRTVINLYLIDGYNHTEIVEMLGIEPSTSKSQLMRGKKLLMKKLQEIGIIENERIERGKL
ncbi:RNA polymerase sigma factor [Dyadobacter chenwenxiniae]|uniref:RNA polymerase sigma factor n=1 Tax=Dyadobacter chenwenxiniae TaxID=2906456 RepID=A0A9X1PPM7_9BACT|nr:RNA polymerase sigma factor [Dyadobacter chenwenxiniae]MCF0064748.1 RNA polymerase sigma factor [Dyadobacter chenwenxiniae]UON84198.1 RNA polymerase sigma factor [Dyadobacter chenwenxiniae]